MNHTKSLIKGTFLLTLTGLATRFIGFFYRIFLSHTIGATGMGLYQLCAPIYSICFGLAIGGIQTAISRFVAAKSANEDSTYDKSILNCGIALSVSIACILTFLLFHFSSQISLFLLKDSRCDILLKLLALSIAPGTIHACINGYYYAKQKAGIPSLSVFLEQIARVAASWTIYLVCLSQKRPLTPVLAAGGVFVGELVAMIFSILAVSIHFQKRNAGTTHFSYITEIFTLSFPLTANRFSLTLLHAVENVLIPSRLLLFGLSEDASLSLYGVLTGMALPLVLFPTAITSSVSVMLLPTIAEAQSSKNEDIIRDTIDSTIKYCLILGIFVAAVFAGYGNLCGLLLFENETCGKFIQLLAWLCPFLYLTATLSSILNGLGKTSLCFWQNTVGLCIRLFFVFFFIPKFGIVSYIWGLLFSEGTITLLSILFLKKCISFPFSITERIGKPILAIFLSLSAAQLAEFLIPQKLISNIFLRLCIILIALTLSYFYCICKMKLIHFPAKAHFQKKS